MATLPACRAAESHPHDLRLDRFDTGWKTQPQIILDRYRRAFGGPRAGSRQVLVQPGGTLPLQAQADRVQDDEPRSWTGPGRSHDGMAEDRPGQTVPERI